MKEIATKYAIYVSVKFRMNYLKQFNKVLDYGFSKDNRLSNAF